MRTYGRTDIRRDMMKLIVAFFCNFVNALKRAVATRARVVIVVRMTVTNKIDFDSKKVIVYRVIKVE